MIKAVTADRIFTGHSWLIKHAVICDEQKIIDIIHQRELSTSIMQFPGCFLAPPFIDLQIYGAAGKLLAVYPNAETLFELYDHCFKNGTSYFLPTVATNKKEVFFKCIDAVRDYWEHGGKGVLGLHIEGPWISKEKRGAHIDSLIHSPSFGEVEELLGYGKDVIKMITLAPEVCSQEVIDAILAHNIIISAGHSNADYQQATKSFNSGITAVTHLYNAMSGLHHREPGLVGATFDHANVMASIIPDGHHVDFGAIRIAKNIMNERLFAITDAVTETSEGYYQHQLQGDKYEAAGVLSGSSLTMFAALQNLVNKVHIVLNEALRMCSLYPARVLNMEGLGQIAKGSPADFNIISNDLKSVSKLNPPTNVSG
jgi:N-acetylglucosamine-6-phosphate deacetylase